MRKVTVVAAVLSALVFFSTPLASGQEERAGNITLETSAIDPFFSIYFLRSHWDVTSRDAFLFGAYYLYAAKTFSGQAYPGDYRGFAPILGYRRFLWKNLYVEDQVFPLYAVYRQPGGDASGFELWDEVHVGYRLDFKLGKLPLFLNLQGLVGFCVLKTGEPASFASAEATNPAFYLPNFYVLPNILVGVRLK